jgi:cytochrome P450
MKAAEAKAVMEKLGLDAAQFRTLGLLPLVEVSWAEGQVQLAERFTIERFAKKKGWLADGGDKVLADWLATRPERELFDQGRAALVALVKDRRGLGASFPDDTLASVLAAARDVATASGGLFGLRDPISPAEGAVLERIAGDFELDVDAPPARSTRASGPRGQLLVGNVPDFVKSPLEFLMSAWRDFGDVIRLEMGPRLVYVVVHPDHAKHVFTDNARNYGRAQGIDVFKELLGDGLLTMDGEPWRRHRRIIQPAFHQKALGALADTMIAIAVRAIEQWKAAGKDATPIDIGQRMSELTLRVAGATLLGADLEGDAAGVVTAAKNALSFMNDRVNSIVKLPIAIPTAANVRFQKAKAELDRVVYGAIEERRGGKAAERPDVLQLLLDAKDPETGSGLDDDEVRDEALTMLGAGTDTSAATLTWVAHFLSTHAAVLHRLRQEVDEVLGDRLPSLEDLPKLTYTKMVIEESMRLRPPFWAVGRSAIAEDAIGGFTIEPGADVIMASYLTHRHPAFWPNPEAFDPERFEAERASAMHPFQWIPFGGGARKCIGAQFAMMEMQLLLPLIVRALDLWLVPGTDAAPLAELVLRPRGGLWMTVHPR